MSVGSIVIELDLNDGGFVARTRRAGRTIRTLEGSFNSLDRSVSRSERGLHKMLPMLRDIAIVGASARTIIHSLNDAFIGWTSNIVKANSEVERLTVLMSGLSDATTVGGKIREAAEDVDLLFDKAQRAPFAINELSNSFVKLKTAGLDDVMGNLNGLTDAIANFGGDNQTLHRATVAIQQMASKGVVSMEELRQQLGESVPSAIKSMAVGMELTVGELVNAISTGAVKAKPAIELMMAEFDKSMAGSSERMMDTWNGMVSRLTTKWIMFQKEVGDAGFFDAAKYALDDAIAALDTDAAAAFAQGLGDALASVVEGGVKLIKFIVENKDEMASFFDPIIEGAKMAASFLKENGDIFGAIAKITAGLYLASKAAGMVVGAFSLVGRAGAALAGVGAAFASIVNPMAAFIGPLPAATTALAAASRSYGILGIAVRGLSAAFAFLGPIGAATTAIYLAAQAWSSYTEDARAAKEETIAAMEAGNNVDIAKTKNEENGIKGGKTNSGVITKSALSSTVAGTQNLKRQADTSRQMIEQIEKSLVRAEVLAEEYGRSSEGWSGLISKMTKESREERLRLERARLMSLEDLIASSEGGLSQSVQQVIESNSGALSASILKSSRKQISLLASTYSTRKNVILRNEEEELSMMKETGKSEVAIRTATKNAIKRISEERYAGELLLLQGQIREIEERTGSFGKDTVEGRGIEIVNIEKTIENTEAAISELQVQRERVSQEIDAAIDGGASVDEIATLKINVENIDKDIKDREKKIKAFVDKIDKMYVGLLELEIPDVIVGKLSSLRDSLKALKELSAEAEKVEGKLNNVNSPAPDAIMHDDKKDKAEIGSLLSMLNSADAKLAKLRSQNAGDSTGYFDQTVQKIKNASRTVEDLIEGYKNLSIADKKLKLTAAIKSSAISIEEQQAVKSFASQIDKLANKVGIAKNAIKNMNGETFEFKWIDEERGKMQELGYDVAMVDSELDSIKVGGTADTDWVDVMMTKLLTLGKSAKEARALIALMRAEDTKRSSNETGKKLTLARSKKKGDNDRVAMEKSIATSKLKGLGDPKAEYEAETIAINNAYQAKLRLREKVSTNSQLSSESKELIEVKKTELIERESARVRESIREDGITHSRKMVDIQYAMVRDGKAKELAILLTEKARRKQDIEDTIRNNTEKAEKLLQVEEEYAASIALIEYEHRSPMDKMLEDWGDTTDKMADAGAAFSDGFAGQLADLMTGGELNFKSLVNSFAKSIVEMQIKAGAADIMGKFTGNDGEGGKAAVFSFLGGVGDLFKGEEGGGSSGDAGAGSSISNFFGRIGDLFSSKEGEQTDKGNFTGPLPQAGSIAKGVIGARTDAAPIGFTIVSQSVIDGSLSIVESITPLSEILERIALNTQQDTLEGDTVGGDAGSMSGSVTGAGKSVGRGVAGSSAAIAEKAVSDQAKEVTQDVGGVFDGGFTDMVSSATDTVVEGFSGMVDSANNILGSGFTNIIGRMMGMVGGGGGGGAIASAVFGAIGAVGGVFGSGGALADFKFADGGTMNAKKTSASKMRNGGVATRASIALFGESTMPEAFIPMEDRKNVPLSIARGADGTITGTIPLPSGETLSTRIVSDVEEGAGNVYKNVSAFATGGTMNASSSSRRSVRSSTLNGDTISSEITNPSEITVIHTVSKMADTIQSLEKVSEGVSGAASMSQAIVSKTDSVSSAEGLYSIVSPIKTESLSDITSMPNAESLSNMASVSNTESSSNVKNLTNIANMFNAKSLSSAESLFRTVSNQDAGGMTNVNSVANNDSSFSSFQNDISMQDSTGIQDMVSALSRSSDINIQAGDVQVPKSSYSGMVSANDSVAESVSDKKDAKGAMPQVTINLTNEGGEEKEASVRDQFMDSEKMVLDIVLSAMSKPGKFSNAMKGAMKR